MDQIRVLLHGILIFVEIVRNGAQDNSFFSINNSLGKFYFRKGSNTQFLNPTYESLENYIYSQATSHYIGLPSSGTTDVLLINGAAAGLMLNHESTAGPVYIGVDISEVTNTTAPQDTLNVHGVVHVFDNSTGGKGIVSLGGMQIQEALDGSNNTIGINIVI